MRIRTPITNRLRVGQAWPLAVLVMVVAAAWLPPAMALDWPQEIDAAEATIVIYQPQPESLVGNVLKGRAAISLEPKDGGEQIFGAMWFAAKIDTDQDSGTALVRSVDVVRVGWPDSKDASEQRFTSVVEAAVPESGFEISLERLAESLETAELEQRSLEGLKNDPPVIVFAEELAVLLLYDGEPRFSPVENSPYERALNTPFVVVRDTRKGGLYLSSGQFWYTAKDPMGPWAVTKSPPADLVKMLPEPDAGEQGPASPPAIVVATRPTELIATDGKPEWKSLPGGELLYVVNTESPWLRELATGNMYVLLSGRWFRAKGQDGPWTFVRADELPASFADIPPASDIGGLRVSVAGTEEAEDAMLDAAIPQTAAIQRSEASLTVEYDGKPKFEKISGTKVAYAVNTGAQVLEIEGRYYAVDNGVWFTSGSAQGPWAVADSVPEDEIQQIPPSSPVYNTTHVHVYDSTPEVVYVGYTPGYLWSYPYYGVPVYGTGWYYPPYWGSWYYPRPPTWGLHVGYNPWSGWNFGVSWSNGFFSFGLSWGGGYGPYRPWGCCGGWYGGGYRGPTIINTGDINIGNNVNIGNRETVRNRIGNDNRINASRPDSRNIYNRTENRARNASPAVARENLQQARESRGRDNNVYADRDGNVARRVGDQWETREQGKWSPSPELADSVSPEARDRVAQARDQATPETRDRVQQQAQDRAGQTTRQSTNRQDLERAHRARQSGASRERARPTSRSMPRQMPAGGGMRRR